MPRLSRVTRLYLGAIYAAGVASLAASWWFDPPATPARLVVTLIAIAAAAAPFRIPVPAFGNVSIAFPFIFAILVLLGTAAATLAAVAAALSASLVRRAPRPSAHQTLFNAANLAVAAAVAGFVYRTAGGTPGFLNLKDEWLPALVATTTYFVLNTGFVALAVSLTNGLPVVRNWTGNFLWTFPAYAAGALLALGMTLGIQRAGLGAVLLAAPPLYVLYFTIRLYSEKVLEERSHGKKLADLYLSVIEALALAIDAKDRTTQRHIRRVQTFAVELGRVMGIKGLDLEALKAGALLHDIGKLAVPEYILCKPGKLSRDELEKMKIHPRIGAEILETVRFPFPLVSVVRSHHEKWDGTGYPDRLQGEEIPLAARILAVVDCFDALTSDRPYRRPLTKEEALRYIRSETGTSYDPGVVEALVQNLARMEALADQVNRTREAWAAPDKRSINRAPERPDRERSAVRTSVMDQISSAHRELYALYEIAQGAAKNLSLDETMGFLASKVARLLHYRCLALHLLEKDGKVLKARFVTGHDAAAIGGLTIAVGDRMSGWAALHRMAMAGRAHADPVRRQGVRSDLEELLAAGRIERLENAVVAPLVDGDALLGVLALYDRPDRPYAEDDVRVISLVAKHVAHAVRNAGLYEAARDNMLTDPVTSLPNARYLFVSFEEELGRAMRQQVPLSILQLDVNNFREINDRFGHVAGDRILRALARVVRAQLRGCDTCVRYAGDEFIVTVPGVGKEGVLKLEGRIQRAVRAHRFAAHGGRQVRLSVGMGSASFPEDGRSIDALMAVADARMDEEKAARRGAKPAETDGYRPFNTRRNVPVN